MRGGVMGCVFGYEARIRSLHAEAPISSSSSGHLLSQGYTREGGHDEHDDSEEEIPVTEALHGAVVREDHEEGRGEARDAGDKGDDGDEEFHRWGLLLVMEQI